MNTNSCFRYHAAVLDLDGVITDTRPLHVKAWKQAFDEFLHAQDKIKSGDPRFRPFDPVIDYEQYVDGKPRSEGIRSFMKSRGIILPEQNLNGTLSIETVQSLGDKKNQYYLATLEKQGPCVFTDAIKAIQRWKQGGISLAVVSSSKNCERVLKKAGIQDLFEVRVDGVMGLALGLKGKPEPDYFLKAAQDLRIDPSHALMVEDSFAGVEAGRRAGFAAVIGMDRSGKNAHLLIQHGATQVISSFEDLINS